jgi:hypothetical protein
MGCNHSWTLGITENATKPSVSISRLLLFNPTEASTMSPQSHEDDIQDKLDLEPRYLLILFSFSFPRRGFVHGCH